jgi:surfactin synthase thioesterase subunit
MRSGWSASDLLSTPFSPGGYSMGGALAYEICRGIDRTGRRMPELLPVAGRQGPAIENTLHHADLPKEEFIDMLRSMGSVPAELIAHPELFGLFEPILRRISGQSSRIARPSHRSYLCR